jgi:hypothetical protein
VLRDLLGTTFESRCHCMRPAVGDSNNTLPSVQRGALGEAIHGFPHGTHPIGHTHTTAFATVVSGHNARRQSRQSDAKWSPCASGEKPDPRLHNARTVAYVTSVSVLTSRDMSCLAIGGVASEVSTKLDLSLGPARPSPGLDCCLGSRQVTNDCDLTSSPFMDSKWK